MKALLALCVLSLAATVQAQNQATAHAPDGGVKQALVSIDIPPLTNSPFTATVATEWTRILPDGSRATIKNRRTVARDSSGRIFEERRYLAPNGDTQPTRISDLEFIDPNRHEIYNCFPAEKTCYLSPYRRPALARMPDGIGGPQACACDNSGLELKQEPLGQQTFENIELTGSRQIASMPPAKFGNDKPEPIVKEFWYSPLLGINVITKRFDPISGIANFQVEQIEQTEPDTRTFTPPQDYAVVKTARPPAIR